MDAEAAAADEAAGEIIDVIDDLTAEDIRQMLSTMDENDLRSLVSYVMDYFTDPNTGEVDYGSVFAMVGDFMDSEWTQEEIAAAEEKLETAQTTVEEAAEKVTDADLWTSVWDSAFGKLSEENIMSWVESMQTGTEQGYEKVLQAEEGLSNLLEGIFGAFVNSPAQ